MKRVKQIALILAGSLLLIGTIGAQTVELYEYDSDHYKILSELSNEHAQSTAAQMEALFETYNEWFHFDTQNLEAPLRVRILADKESFDTHLQKIIDSSRDDFVYLHYSRADRSELVGFASPDDKKSFDKSLAHQGFIQFLKAYVDHPPLWMREGFAVFFETAQWDSSAQKLTFEENLQWLPTLKKMIADYTVDGLIPLPELLVTDEKAMKVQADIFIPQAWAMVSFLTQTENQRFNRILWDSIATMKDKVDLTTNSANVAEKAFGWVEKETLNQQYYAYVDSRKSYRELIESGILAYSNEGFAEARGIFQKALAVDSSFYVPYYYLGLIAYGEKQYDQADYYYEAARSAGGSGPLIDYAQGVNAYAAENIDTARSYLTSAEASDPETYQEKAQEILTRIELYY